MSSGQQKEKYCYFYIQQEDEDNLTNQEILKFLENGKFDEKIKALKKLIINILHDDSFPRMLMPVINYIVPIQNESHALKKILFYYWEVIN